MKILYKLVCMVILYRYMVGVINRTGLQSQTVFVSYSSQLQTVMGMGMLIAENIEKKLYSNISPNAKK